MTIVFLILSVLSWVAHKNSVNVRLVWLGSAVFNLVLLFGLMHTLVYLDQLDWNHWLGGQDELPLWGYNTVNLYLCWAFILYIYTSCNLLINSCFPQTSVRSFLWLQYLSLATISFLVRQMFPYPVPEWRWIYIIIAVFTVGLVLALNKLSALMMTTGLNTWYNTLPSYVKWFSVWAYAHLASLFYSMIIVMLLVIYFTPHLWANVLLDNPVSSPLDGYSIVRTLTMVDGFINTMTLNITDLTTNSVVTLSCYFSNSAAGSFSQFLCEYTIDGVTRDLGRLYVTHLLVDLPYQLSSAGIHGLFGHFLFVENLSTLNEYISALYFKIVVDNMNSPEVIAITKQPVSHLWYYIQISSIANATLLKLVYSLIWVTLSLSVGIKLLLAVVRLFKWW